LRVELQAGGLYALVDHCLGVYDWTGSMLDLACGTGYSGEGIHKHGFRAQITGVELSPLMARKDAIEEVPPGPHPCCAPGNLTSWSPPPNTTISPFRAHLHFLDSANFTTVLSRMFMVAKKFITFEVDDSRREVYRGV
jgi:trans-aconitate methyltransferase